MTEEPDPQYRSEARAFIIGSCAAMAFLLLLGKCAWDNMPRIEPVHALGAQVNPPAAFPVEGK